MKILNILDLDNTTELSKNGSFKWAKNIQFDKSRKSLEIENGLDEVYDFSKYGYLGKIVTAKELILFYYDIANDKLKIYNVTNTVKLVITINDNRYKDQIIDGTFTYNYNNELIITFGTINHDNTPEILILNVDANTIIETEVGDSRYNNLLLNSNYFNTAHNYEITTKSGSLNTGTYFLSFCYEDDNENTSSFATVSRAIVINTNDTKKLKSGVSSGKSIQLTLTGLSENYSKVKIAIIYYQDNSINSVKLTNTINYSDTKLTYNISSISTLTDSSVDEIITRNSKYTHSKSFANSSDTLLLGGVKIDKFDFDICQRVANNVIINHNTTYKYKRNLTEDTTYSGIIKTFDSTENIYNKQPFKYGEIYAFYIGFKYIKGGYISVNPIPANTEVLELDKSDLIINNKLEAITSSYKYPNHYPEIGGEYMRFHKFPEMVDVNSEPDGYIKLLGIDIENVIIPDELATICGGWEILYAKRTAENITRLGNALALDSRFSSFDLQYTSYPSSNIDKLIHIATLDFGNAIISDRLIDLTKMSLIDNTYKYEEIDVDSAIYISGIDDKNTYDHVKFKVSNYEDLELDDYNLVGDPSFSETIEAYKINNVVSVSKPKSDTDTSGGYLLGQAVLFDIATNNDTASIYSDIENQTLISTGITIDKNITFKNNLFGGDVYINRYPIKEYGTDVITDSDINDTWVIYLCMESSYNTELRHEGGIVTIVDEDDTGDIDEFRLIYPQSSLDLIIESPNKYGEYINDEYGNSYDTTYSKLSDIENPTVLSKDYPNTFYKRIVRSTVNSSESLTLGWKTFKVNDYLDLPYNKGDIINIKSADKKLFIQLQYGLYVAQVKDILQLSDASQAWLGAGDIFDRAPEELLFDDTGGISCRDRNSCIYTKYGYIVADRYNNTIYTISDKVTDISNTGFKQWFEDLELKDVDNLITITDDIDGRDRLLIDFTHYLMSYSVSLNGLLSSHDYPFVDGASNTVGSYILNNKLYKFNNKRTTYNAFVDINIISNEDDSLLFDTIIFDTKYLENNQLQYNKTIDDILIYNDTQCSGYLPINTPNMYYDTNGGTFIAGKWHYNNFKDAVINDNLPVMLDYQPTENVDRNQKLWFEMSQFISKFITVRLRAINNDTTIDRNIKFIDIRVKVAKNIR